MSDPPAGRSAPWPRRLLRSVRKRAHAWNDRRGLAWGVDRWWGRLEARASIRVDAAAPDVRVEGVPPPIRCLIGTSHAGLLLYDAGSVRRLLDAAGVYGASRGPDGLWYVFHKTGGFGRIVALALSDGRVAGARTVLRGFSRGIHQIDFLPDGRLVVTDTYQNALLVYDDVTRLHGSSWRAYDRRATPGGELERGRESPNYHHLNSVVQRGDELLVVAHNETVKSGRQSELFVLAADDLGLRERRPLGGSNCHNVVVDAAGRLLVCRSIEGTLARDGEDVFDAAGFTRGLAVSADWVLLGSSQLEPDRSKRGATDGRVHFLGPELAEHATLILPGTQVQEIRRLDAPDHGLGAAFP